MYKTPDTRVCERGNDLIAFMYGEIEGHALRDFERHLLNCAECESQRQAFKQIRSSVVAWRQESLGGATATSFVDSPAVDRASDVGKRSAMAAIRKFFELSPMWMKGSIAFASVLFCVFSILAFAHLFESSKPAVVVDGKRYTETELQTKIEDAVKSTLEDLETQRRTTSSLAANNNQQVKLPRSSVIQPNERVAGNPKIGRSPLTRAEREQLAADLRLILPQEDTDLDLLSDRINR